MCYSWMIPLLLFPGLCAGWAAEDMQWHHFIYVSIMFSFRFHLLLQSFGGRQTYGAVVSQNPPAVLAAWHDHCCYSCQTLYFCPLKLDCFKKSDRLSPNSWSFHRRQKINLQNDACFHQGFCDKQLFKTTRSGRGEATAAGWAWPWTSVVCCLCFPSIHTSVVTNAKQTH